MRKLYRHTETRSHSSDSTDLPHILATLHEVQLLIVCVSGDMNYDFIYVTIDDKLYIMLDY